MSVDPADGYPDLAHLRGAYLNQDYVLYDPKLEDSVSALCKDEPATYVAATRADIARLLRDNAGDLDASLGKLDPGRAQPPETRARDHLLWRDGLLADALAAAPARGHAAE
jgi:CdiI immunity protein